MRSLNDGHQSFVRLESRAIPEGQKFIERSVCAVRVLVLHDKLLA